MDILVIQTLATTISQGNPGALSVLISVAREHPEQFTMFTQTCLRKRWLGSDLWVKYKECNQNVSELLLRAAHEQNGNNTQQ
jgi:hypothetical protein